MPAQPDETMRKFHASLNVSDLARSVAFYRVLFGTEPAKLRPDYAKFELEEPALVLSLVPGRSPGAGGHLNHAGLRMRTSEELVEVQRRLEAAGMRTEREEGVECCYSRQTKFWISDPDRALWEIYVLHEDIDHHGKGSVPAVSASTFQLSKNVEVPRVWEHRLRDAIPGRIPHDDNSLHEVRLVGTINAAPAAPHRNTLIAETLRVLRPGAPVYIHGLAGDRPNRGTVSLSGPAADVTHVPATADVVAELAEAGFTGIQLEHLSHGASFVVDGVPMREVRIVARKPGHRPRASAHQAIYLGPMKEVTDDFGNVFHRGIATPLNVHDWQALSMSAAAGAFLLLTPEDAKKAGSCECAPAMLGLFS